MDYTPTELAAAYRLRLELTHAAQMLDVLDNHEPDWLDPGETADGCIVEPDGICEHGFRSWLIVANLI